MQNDILFDNIYIGHSVADAEAFANQTYTVKHASEKAEEEKDKPKDDDIPKSPSDLKFMDDPVVYVREKFDLFMEIEAVKFVPEIAGGLAVGVVTLLIVIVGLVGGGAKAAPSKEQVKAKANEAKDAAQKTKEQVADAVASGTDKAKEEVSKRTTRSAAQ